MRAAPTLLVLACFAVAEEEPPVRGLDVIDSVKTIQKWMGPGTPDPKKPWASSLGALTDPDPQIHAPAIRALVIRGAREAQVVKDLQVLAGDGDWRIRSRVVQVLDGIGGEASAPLLIDLSHDREARVRELATFALGKTTGPMAYRRLVELLRVPEGPIRQAAAASLGAFGNPEAIAVLSANDGETDDLVLRERERALARLAGQPKAVPVLLRLLPASTSVQRDILIQTAQLTGDRRLSPALAAIAVDPGAGAADSKRSDPSAWTQYLALNALSTCGDLRAVPPLLGLATGTKDEVASRTAETLALITGYRAQAGSAWKLWWTDRQQDLPRWSARDELLATLHDPEFSPARDMMSAFTVQELTPLVDAVLGAPAGRLSPWFPGRALEALRADDPARWTAALADRAIAAPTRQVPERLGLILLIDDLDGPQAIEDLGRILADLKKRITDEEKEAEEKKLRAPDHGPEMTAIEGALLRRKP